MILTLAWKELREHQSIWLTMVIGIIASFIGGYITVALGYRNAK